MLCPPLVMRMATSLVPRYRLSSLPSVAAHPRVLGVLVPSCCVCICWSDKGALTVSLVVVLSCWWRVCPWGDVCCWVCCVMLRGVVTGTCTSWGLASRLVQMHVRLCARSFGACVADNSNGKRALTKPQQLFVVCSGHVEFEIGYEGESREWAVGAVCL